MPKIPNRAAQPQMSGNGRAGAGGDFLAQLLSYPKDRISADLQKLPLVSLDELVYDPDNARLHPERNLLSIMHSLALYGQRSNITVNRRTMHVEKGNGTLAAARRLGWSKLAVSFEDDDPATAAGYGLADNRTAELAQWNAEVVQRLGWLVQEAEAAPPVGWTLEEIASLHTNGNPNSDDQAITPLPSNSISKPGDLWLLGDHRLLCGDGTKAEDVSHLLGNARPLLMVTDPPYGVDYNPTWRHARGLIQSPRTGSMSNDGFSDWRTAWSLFPGHVAYVWHAGLRARQAIESLEACGFILRAQIIWVKQQIVIGRGHYHFRHEPCWYAVRKDSVASWTGDRKQSTVWEIDNPLKSGEVPMQHGTQKPIECMSRPIRNHGNPGDLVYDPFVGTGTTIIAAHQLGRRCLAIDIDPVYVDMALQRFYRATSISPIREADGKRWNDLQTKKPAS